MKTALLHYWLTNVRGGEKVLAALGKIFPEADVFAHAYVQANMEGMFEGVSFFANSSAKIRQNLQIAKLFFLARKMLKCLTFCISTRAAEGLKMPVLTFSKKYNSMTYNILLQLPSNLHSLICIP